MTTILPKAGQPVPEQSYNARLMETAKQLEASFLAEMLKSAGVGEARQSFGGGAGEDHFSGFLVQEYASATVKSGGIGLAETIYYALARKENST
ncbi:MAG: rod-binding protein [Pseudomonadota bacterium]